MEYRFCALDFSYDAILAMSAINSWNLINFKSNELHQITSAVNEFGVHQYSCTECCFCKKQLCHSHVYQIDVSESEFFVMLWSALMSFLRKKDQKDSSSISCRALIVKNLTNSCEKQLSIRYWKSATTRPASLIFTLIIKCTWLYYSWEVGLSTEGEEFMQT